MMRANLLPRPREAIGAFGFEMPFESFRTGVFGFSVVLAVALVGNGIEHVRLHTLESLALGSEAQFAARAAQRAESKRLALEVARYQQFAREAQTFRRSGSDAAIVIARIGNSVPRQVWLESLSRETHDYHISGRAESVDALGAAIVDFGRALPGADASLIDIDNRSAAENGALFSAKISMPVSDASNPALAPQSADERK